MKAELRVKIDREEQRKLFKKFKEKIGSRNKASKILQVKEGTYKSYSSAKTKYVPKEIINKICSTLKEPLPKILEFKTLKEIRQTTIKRTYPALKKKYGEDWQKVLAIRGHKALQKKYGKNWRKIIAKRGHETSKNLYGKNFYREIWKKALISLERKYGKNWSRVNSKKSIKASKKKYGSKWAEILMENARKTHIQKYGKNWPKILSKKGNKKLKEKYGKNYHQHLYTLANLIGKHPLTHQEKTICRHLKKNKISFETHCIKNNREYDIIIPNLKNPKIVIESSNLNPTTHNERYKILQLLEQKKNFPSSLNIAILKRRSKYNNFNQSTYNFLLDQGILVFWNEDLKIVIHNIYNYLKNKDKYLLRHKYTDFNEFKNNSLGGALCCKKKVSKSELKLHKLLNKIKANPQGQHIMQTKYSNFIAIDNFEKIKNVRLAYEITNTKNQNTLCFLAGKIIYLKKLYKNLKFIVILTKRKELINRIGDRSISKYADLVILKDQFNEEGLINARNQIFQFN